MKYTGICLLGVCLAAFAVAWHNRFIQDDAFISFCYARQLVEGHGLTWFDTRIEGYTNFLWVLWIALGLLARVDAVVWAHAGSLAAFLVAIYALWRLSARLFDARLPRFTAVGLFVTNYTVSAYATGGLETMLQTALLSLAAWQFYEFRRARGALPQTGRLIALSVILALATLTRMDSLLPGGIIGLCCLVAAIRRRVPHLTYVWTLLPFVLLVGGWLVWKQVYYGTLLPNAFHAKVQFEPAALRIGGLYLARFLHWYLIWPFLLIAIPLLIARRRLSARDTWPLWVIVASWCAYIVAVGGDFMEFRFIVPITPYVFLFLAFLFCQVYPGNGRRLRWVTTALGSAVLVGASYWHATTFTKATPDDTLDSIPRLNTFYDVYSDGDWGKLGRALRAELGQSDVVLATSAVGAIPYYSRLKTIDMLGLNDADVPVHGDRTGAEYPRPGHRAQAKLSYLKQKGVHLLLGHPRTLPRGELSDPDNAVLGPYFVRGTLLWNKEPIGNVTLVSMPVDDKEALVMWYLMPHPRIEQRIQSGRWERIRFHVPR